MDVYFCLGFRKPTVNFSLSSLSYTFNNYTHLVYTVPLYTLGCHNISFIGKCLFCTLYNSNTFTIGLLPILVIIFLFLLLPSFQSGGSIQGLYLLIVILIIYCGCFSFKGWSVLCPNCLGTKISSE